MGLWVDDDEPNIEQFSTTGIQGTYLHNSTADLSSIIRYFDAAFNYTTLTIRAAMLNDWPRAFNETDL